jgi:hypothetical protein
VRCFVLLVCPLPLRMSVVVAAVPQATHWEFRRPPRKAERIKKVGDERRVRALARWSLLLRPAPANGCCRRRTPLTTGGQVRCGRTCTTRQIIDAAPWSGQILITVSVCASKAFALPLTAVCPEHRRHVETRMEEEKMHAQDDVLRKVQFRQRERTKLQTRRKANYQSAVPGTQLHTVPATPATPAGVPAAKPPTRYGQPVAIKDRDYYRRDGYLWSDLVHVAPERMHLVVRPEMLEADEVTQPPARHHNTPPPHHTRDHTRQSYPATSPSLTRSRLVRTFACRRPRNTSRQSWRRRRRPKSVRSWRRYNVTER